VHPIKSNAPCARGVKVVFMRIASDVALSLTNETQSCCPSLPRCRRSVSGHQRIHTIVYADALRHVGYEDHVQEDQ